MLFILSTFAQPCLEFKPILQEPISFTWYCNITCLLSYGSYLSRLTCKNERLELSFRVLKCKKWALRKIVFPFWTFWNFSQLMDSASMETYCTFCVWLYDLDLAQLISWLLQTLQYTIIVVCSLKIDYHVKWYKFWSKIEEINVPIKESFTRECSNHKT